MSHRKKTYVVCLSNKGYPAALEPRKLYLSLADEDAERHGLLRVVDESGEDYLYERTRFSAIKLPRAVEQALSESDPASSSANAI